MGRLHALAIGACCAVASCALMTPNSARVYEPRGATQELLVRTDPPGAACSVLQEGAEVAAVDSTPGTATVRRMDAPVEIGCRKDGFLDVRAAFPALQLHDRLNFGMEGEARPRYHRTAGDFAEYMALNILGMTVLPAGIAMSVYLSLDEEKKNPPYAYRRLPEIVLPPAAFASEPERDAFFAALSARLEGAAAAQRAVVDATCHYWPCQASDATPCADPMCQRRREWIDGELGIQLELIPGLRSRASVVPATVPQEPP